MKRYPFDKQSVVIYWLLLLVPTLVIGITAFRLLSHEQYRIDQQFKSSVMDRLNTVAGSIRLAVSRTEDMLVDLLLRIDDSALADTLEKWKRTDPVIRNVFIWNPSDGLQLPSLKQPITSEDRQFIARYESLFSRRTPWKIPKGESDATANMASGTAQSVPQSVLQNYGGPLERSKAQLYDIIKRRPFSGTESSQARLESGWIPWFSENNLYLLGWASRDMQAGPYFGVEIETVSLIAQISSLMPQDVPQGLVYCLLDGSGRVIHHSGARSLSEDVQPNLTVSLAPSLPHWQVAAYFVAENPVYGSARSFIILGGLLLAIFIAAIIVGGSMLLRQAHRNKVDAMQKTSFVSNVSHELKTPLTNIRMYAELLNSARIKDSEKQKRYLEVVVAESERLSRLVNNVLDFSRLEQGRKKYRLEEVDLLQATQELIETQRLRLIGSGVLLDLVPPREQASAIFDRDALEQVMLNLIDNAIKYGCKKTELGDSAQCVAQSDSTSNGERLLTGQKDTVRREEPECKITIALDNKADCVEIRIMDRGPGVPVEHRDRIFEKFHRVDDSLTTCQPGCGLGLSISRRLLRDLGGDLSYEVREGGGSVFVVGISRGREP